MISLIDDTSFLDLTKTLPLNINNIETNPFSSRNIKNHDLLKKDIIDEAKKLKVLDKFKVDKKNQVCAFIKVEEEEIKIIIKEISKNIKNEYIALQTNIYSIRIELLNNTVYLNFNGESIHISEIFPYLDELKIDDTDNEKIQTNLYPLYTNSSYGINKEQVQMIYNLFSDVEMNDLVYQIQSIAISNKIILNPNFENKNLNSKVFEKRTTKLANEIIEKFKLTVNLDEIKEELQIEKNNVIDTISKVKIINELLKLHLTKFFHRKKILSLPEFEKFIQNTVFDTLDKKGINSKEELKIGESNIIYENIKNILDEKNVSKNVLSNIKDIIEKNIDKKFKIEQKFSPQSSSII